MLERHQKETEDKQRARDLENTVHTDVDGSQIQIQVVRAKSKQQLDREKLNNKIKNSFSKLDKRNKKKSSAKVKSNKPLDTVIEDSLSDDSEEIAEAKSKSLKEQKEKALKTKQKKDLKKEKKKMKKDKKEKKDKAKKYDDYIAKFVKMPREE